MNQRNMQLSVKCVIAALMGVVGSVHAQNVLLNSGFETLGSGSPGNRFQSWVDFENCVVQDLDPRTGQHCAKAFGNGTGPYNPSGLYQEFTATPGSGWKASTYVRNRSADAIQGANIGLMNIEWYTGSNTLISTDTMTVANAATPVDQWIFKEGIFVAPPGAVKGRFILLHLQAATDTGSVQWDDASVQPYTLVTNQLQNPSFETLGGGSPGFRFASWTDFNNCYVQTQAAHQGGISAKAWGNWGGAYNPAGLWQEIPASPGQNLVASVFVFNSSQDAIAGLNFAAMNIEWYNGTSFISYDSTAIADVNTPLDQWIRREATFVAPPGTTKARYVLLHLQAATDPGSVLFDDASLGVPVAVCYANCDGSSSAPLLTANDFQCFLNKFASADPYANCDGSTATPVLTANDFQCFLNQYASGCT